MRTCLAVCTVASCLVLAGSARAEEKKPDSKGHFARVEFKRDTAGTPQKIKVPAGAHVEIEYTYPIAPPFPTGSEGHSSDPAVVKFGHADTVIVYPRLLGVGRLGAFFVAEKKGKAELTYELKYPKGEELKLKVEVEVE